MAIQRLKLVTITGNESQLDKVLTRFVEFRPFHPVPATQIAGSVHGLTTLSVDNISTPIIHQLEEIEAEFNLNVEPILVSKMDYSVAEMQEYLSQSYSSLKKFVDEVKALEENIRLHQEALQQVKSLESIDLEFDEMFACEYLNTRLGKMPIESVEKLKYYRTRPFIFRQFRSDNDYIWCMYITSREYEREVDNIFTSLYFNRIWIPEFVHGRPATAVNDLQRQIESYQQQIVNINENIRHLSEDYHERLALIKGELFYLNRIIEARKYVIMMGNRFSIQGFCEIHDVDRLKDYYSNVEDIEITVRSGRSDKRIHPPTILKNGWFSKPFEIFVSMYGLPKYGEVDPTPFVAITYTLLFGIMFGDLGQGLLLSLIGWAAWKFKKMKLGAIGMRIGITSAFFGLLYGSVFGNEELLTPFFTNILGLPGKPIHVMDANFTMTLLLFAIGIGVLLIIMSMLLNIYSLARKKHYVEMLVSHNGVAGMIFYVFLLSAVALPMAIPGLQLLNIWTEIFLIGVPLVLMFLKEPLERMAHGHKMFPTGFGGYFAEGFFELFEILLSYVTNTMSYLRVGGFVLSHAGMMLVVMSLMEMVGSSGWLVFILGNLFVMALEGLIVGIQVLRLEFYEMFSRYYTGDGIEFVSI